jgi:hypothetical protein
MGAASASPGAPLEGWYHAYKAGGLAALEARPRADRGGCKAIPKDIAQQILALRREQPRRSVRILIRAVERAKLVKDGELAPSTVSRLLRAHGLSQRPRVLPERERRAFTVPLPGDLWVGDAMHGPPVIGRDGALHTKTYLLSQIDVASRYLIHSEFFLQEDAGHQEDGLRRAIVSHGLPRDYYVDRGAGLHRRVAADDLRRARDPPPPRRPRRRRGEGGDRALPQDLARRGRQRAAPGPADPRRPQRAPHRLGHLRVPPPRPRG